MHTDEVTSRRRGTSAPPRAAGFVGRQHALNTSTDALARGQSVVIEGVAGIGKSRLLGELCDHLRRHGHQTELVHAGPSTIPFAPFVHLLDPGDVPATDLTDQMARLTASLRPRGDSGAVTLVDDAHDLDDPSIALLHQLIARAEGQLVLAVDAAVTESRLHSLWRSDRIVHLDLGPLSREETGELVLALAGPDADAASIWNLSDGNPLFISELVALGWTDDADGMGSSVGYARSRRLQGAIGARLDQLRANERSFFETLSVAHSLPLTVAERLLPLGDISSIERSGLVRVSRTADGPVVTPAHHLQREMALELAGEASLQLARRQAIEALEAVGTEDSPMRIDAARIRVEANMLDPAPLEVAAEMAMQRFDATLAATLAAAATRGGSTFHGPLIEAAALASKGCLDEAARRLDQMASWSLDAQHLSLVTLHQANLEVLWRGDIATAEQLLRTRIESVGPEFDVPLRVFLATVLFFSGRPAAAVAAASTLLDAEVFPPDAAVPLTSAWSVLGDPDAVVAVIGRLQDRLRRDGPRAVDSLVMSNVPFTWLLACWQRGELRGAHPLDPFHGPTAHPALASPTLILLPAAGDLMTGHLDDMAEAYERHSVHVDLGPQPVRVMHRILLTMMHSLRGEVDQARTRRSELNLLPPQQIEGFSWWVARADVLLRCAEGDVEGAVTRSLELANHHPEYFHRAISLHDAVRMGRADLVVEAVEVLERREGATWFDHVVARHAQALAVADGPSLLEVAETFEVGGLDLYALEAAAQAARAAVSPVLAQPASDRVARLLLRCGQIRTPAVLAAPPMLTSRELQVASMASQGLSNKEIAARFGTSVRTVGNQLQSVYQKLGVRSREGLHGLW